MCWGARREKKEGEKLVREERTRILAVYIYFFPLLAFHEFLFWKEFWDVVVITSGFLPGGLWLFEQGLELAAVAGHASAVCTEQDKSCRRLKCGWMEQNMIWAPCSAEFLDFIRSHGVEKLHKVHDARKDGLCVGLLLAGPAAGEGTAVRLALQVCKVPCSLSLCCNV